MAVMYFLPGSVLSAFLPSGVVRFRIAYPVAVLCIGGLLAGMDLRFALAFLFSCTGDAFGAAGSFIGQMGFFALAHIALIYCFIRRLRKGCTRVVSTSSTTASGRVWIGFKLAAVAAILILACVCVLPRIEERFLVWGCGIYALLLCTMAALAMFQRSPMFALGALLFAISDLILSWNKFVGPVAFEKYLIMLPYYLGQALLWLGALKVSLWGMPKTAR
jgi:uncharacterized membrane protein YhhN